MLWPELVVQRFCVGIFSPLSRSNLFPNSDTQIEGYRLCRFLICGTPQCPAIFCLRDHKLGDEQLIQKATQKIQILVAFPVAAIYNFVNSCKQGIYSVSTHTIMASDLLQFNASAPSYDVRRRAGGVRDQRMRKDSLIRFSAIGLAVATVVCVVFAFINWQKQSPYFTPSDGVWWMENGKGLMARAVTPNGPGDKAGIKVGDRLLRINGHPAEKSITSFVQYQKLLYGAGAYSKDTYLLDRQGVNVEVTSVIPVPAETSMNAGLRLIALIYLGIGLYVLFRRWTAPKSTHFYVFCLVSFVLYAFKFTGQLDALDIWVLSCNLIATALQPALFLHFAISFTDDEAPRPGRHLLYPFLYLPGAVLLTLRYLS